LASIKTGFHLTQPDPDTQDKMPEQHLHKPLLFRIENIPDYMITEEL
jgi:hypothetical protein